MTSKLLNSPINRKKVKSFFQGENWKKGLTFFFFLLIAFGFWLLQYLQQKFEIETSISLTYKNIPAEIVLSDSLPQKINLKIFDKGTILLNYSISKKTDPIDIDLKDISLEKISYTVSQTYLKNEISRRIMSSSTLLSYSPTELIITYKPLSKKKIPICLNGSISPAPGYMLVDSLHFNPKYLMAFGSNDMLDTLHSVYTDPFAIKDINKSFEKKIGLELPKGFEFDQSEVILSGDIEGYTEKTVTVPITCKNLPENYFIRLFPSAVEVTCHVALSKYASLKQDSFLVHVDYNQLILDKKGPSPIELVSKPIWLKDCRISPDHVEFLIEKKMAP